MGIETSEAVRSDTPDMVMILEPLRDQRGVFADAVVEAAHGAFREPGGAEGSAVAGRRFLDVFPGLEEQLADVLAAATTGERVQRIAPGLENPAQRAVLTCTPVGSKVVMTAQPLGSDHGPAGQHAGEEHYRAIVDAMAEGIVLQAADGSIEACNARAEEVLGLTRDQMAGVSSIDPRWQAIHEDGSPFPGNTHPAMVTLATGKPCSDVIMGVHKPDGALTWISVDSQPLFQPGEPKPYAVVATFSELGPTREALRASKERFRELANSLTDLVYAVDRDLRYTFWNVQSERTTGIAAADAIGRTMDEVFPGIAGTVTERLVLEVLATGEPRSVSQEFPLQGESLWFDVRISPTPEGASFVARDVTALVRATEALRNRGAELAEAQRIAHVGSATWSAATGEATWSDELFQIFGLPPGGAPPTLEELARYLEPATYARGQTVIARAIDANQPFELEMSLRRLDGGVRQVVARGEITRGTNGDVSSVRGSVADVTELRSAQALADRAQRMELVGRLASGVAHDFNNLLVVINGNAELLVLAMAEGDPRREDVEAIREAGARGVALTRRLLSFGRQQVSQGGLIAIDEMIGELLPIMRNLVGDRVTVVSKAGNVGLVQADRVQLEQALVNLVGNARDAMPNGGRVMIATSSVTISAADPRIHPAADAGAYIRITVTDTGVGIDQAILEDIFEPFFTTKPPGTGTGLGLAIVEGAVAQAGGFVTLESIVGSGTTFSMYVPEVTSDIEAPATPSQGPIHGVEAVLLVDDEPAVRTVTARMLRECGYTVVEAPSAAVAMAIAASGAAPFDILVTDIVMPDMGGYELADAMLAMRPGLPVLFISAHAALPAADGRWSGRSGEVLAKPFTRVQIAARVRAHLDRQSAQVD